ncbi:MAG: glycerol-3-phosphate acyltransferase [Oscillospiraceae bacterium]|nr:glycerol-3-phosphate acyltransferase [Oscillospiraceae bacterium]
MKNAKRTFNAIASAGVGYALGEINSAYILGMRKGYDIRKKGTGNAGATNTMLLEGKLAGGFVMLFDMGKAVAAVKLCQKLFPDYISAGETAGTAAILGHMFPALLDFRGGKGLACIGGTILALGDFPVMISFATAVLLKTRYLCAVPISASVFYPLYRGFTTRNWHGAAILGTVAIPVFAKHLENLKRIQENRELKVDFLWNKEKELERTGLQEVSDMIDRGEIPDKHPLPPMPASKEE